jgi:hypothetical protein
VGYERHFADLQFLRRGEECHIQGIVIKGIHQGAFVYDPYAETLFFTGDAAGEPDGARTDYQEIRLNRLHPSKVSFHGQAGDCD